MEEIYFAHSLEGKPPEQWQRLDEYLKNVANLAHELGAVEWGYVPETKDRG